MTTSRLIPAGFLIAAMAVSAAVMATAQNAPDSGTDTRAAKPARAEFHDGDRAHGKRHHRAHWRRGGGELFTTLFDAVDGNADGAVTQEEVDAFRAAKLAEADASGDGALSIEEFDTLYREFTRPRMVDAFQDLDADGDGVITAAEMDGRFGRIVERMDRDGDGSLTLQRRGGHRH